MRSRYLIVAVTAVTLLGGAIFMGCEQEAPVSSDGAQVRSLDVDAASIVNVNGGSACVPLIAGQFQTAGTVCFDDVDTDADDVVDALEITVTTSDWTLTEVKLWVATTFVNAPVNKSGNPVPGHFPYRSGTLSGSTYTVTVPFAEIGVTCGQVQPVFVATHATVAKNGRTETAWGEGTRFVARGNWAMYSVVAITCDEVEEPPQETYKPAFAAGDNSACFLDLDLDGDDELDFTDWGWLNGPLGVGGHDMVLYADAQGCDGTSGTAVGTVHVEYDGATATVTYTMFPGYTLDASQLHVGNLPLPMVGGVFSVSPADFPYSADHTMATTYTYSVAITGGIYVVAHAVVGSTSW